MLTTKKTIFPLLQVPCDFFSFTIQSITIALFLAMNRLVGHCVPYGKIHHVWRNPHTLTRWGHLGLGGDEISLAECLRSPYSISPWLLYPHQFWGVNHEFPDSETCQLQSLILKSPILKKSFFFSKLMSCSNHENLGFSPGFSPFLSPGVPSPSMLPACRTSASSRAKIQAAGQKPGEPEDLQLIYGMMESQRCDKPWKATSGCSLDMLRCSYKWFLDVFSGFLMENIRLYEILLSYSLFWMENMEV